MILDLNIREVRLSIIRKGIIVRFYDGKWMRLARKLKHRTRRERDSLYVTTGRITAMQTTAMRETS